MKVISLITCLIATQSFGKAWLTDYFLIALQCAVFTGQVITVDGGGVLV